jgi:hypothetical protein
MDKLNVGTPSHPIYLGIQSAVALAHMQTRVYYTVRRSEWINSLLNRGLVKQDVDKFPTANSEKITIVVTKRGDEAKNRMRKLIF